MSDIEPEEMKYPELFFEVVTSEGGATRTKKIPIIFERDGHVYIRWEGEDYVRRLRNGEGVRVVWEDQKCLARTEYGEQCKLQARHEGRHAYTSSADGRSISWETKVS